MGCECVFVCVVRMSKRFVYKFILPVCCPGKGEEERGGGDAETDTSTTTFNAPPMGRGEEKFNVLSYAENK